MADATVTSFAGPHTWIMKGVLQSQWTSWAGVTTGLPVEAPHLPDKTVAVHGTWGSATFVIEGSSDGTNYFTLNDTRGEGNPISLTADNIVTILENVRYIRGKTTGGTGTALTVTITSQSSQR